MTKGIKNVDWTKQENNIKLLVAVLKHVDVSKSYDAIAKVFGKFSSILLDEYD